MYDYEYTTFIVRVTKRNGMSQTRRKRDAGGEEGERKRELESEERARRERQKCTRADVTPSRP